MIHTVDAETAALLRTVPFTPPSAPTTTPTTPDDEPKGVTPTPTPTPVTLPAPNAVTAEPGKDLELPVINLPLAELTEIKFGDRVLERGEDKDYTAREGSTIITLTSRFIDTLPAGTHTITINFATGTVEQSVVKATGTTASPNVTNPPRENPRTHENGSININIFIVISVASAFGLIAITFNKLYKKRGTK
jgi:hypothetical protein